LAVAHLDSGGSAEQSHQPRCTEKEHVLQWRFTPAYRWRRGPRDPNSQPTTRARAGRHASSTTTVIRRQQHYCWHWQTKQKAEKTVSVCNSIRQAGKLARRRHLPPTKPARDLVNSQRHQLITEPLCRANGLALSRREKVKNGSPDPPKIR
jgi:hypothetical protein